MAEPDFRVVISGWSGTPPFLPDELWANIFLYTLPDNPSFSLCESPTLVARVCRTWRRIAVSYPLLWSRISLASSHDSLSLGTVELFKTWLKRSKKCPLDVDLRLPFDVLPWSIAINDREFKIINELLSLLYKHAPRLRSLLRGFPQILNKVLQADDLPLLELFIVDPPEGELCTFPIISLPPNLKSFAAFNTYIHFTPATRWPQLEHLELWQTDSGFAGLSAGDCLDILSQLPSLRSAGLHISVDDDESSMNFPNRVTLPALRCLIISSFVEHDISVLLATLSTPALEAVGFDGCASHMFLESLPDFIAQCAHTLRLVVLGQVGVITVTLLGALTSCPSRSRIALCCSSFDGHVAARVGRARCMERGIEYADRWTSRGSPGHLLSLAYASEEMWSDTSGQEAAYSFPDQTFRDFNQWAPAVRPTEGEVEDEQAGSVKLSICRGQSASHTSFCDSWLSKVSFIR